MTDKAPTVWTAERIQTLSGDELDNLRANATRHGRGDIALLCEAEAAGRTMRAPKPGNTRTKAAVSAEIPVQALERMVAKIVALPPVEVMGNGKDRLRRQAAPAETLAELWRQFIICGFSSQENAEVNSALGQFVRADGPLLSLDEVGRNGCDAIWVEQEVRRHPLRLWPNKVALVTGAYPWFERAGRPAQR